MSKIKDLRILSGDTIADVSRKTNTNHSNLARIEKGLLPASANVMKILSDFYGVPSCDLFDERGFARDMD